VPDYWARTTFQRELPRFQSAGADGFEDLISLLLTESHLASVSAAVRSGQKADMVHAALELVACARRGVTFSSRSHLADVIEQRFVSRTHDRRRAPLG